jgi:signal recognition particle subunit SRP54
MDGDARGGAAISIRSVTGVPIKFLGTGEALDALEVYDPGRLSSRILGMGDMIGLIEGPNRPWIKRQPQTSREDDGGRVYTGRFRRSAAPGAAYGSNRTAHGYAAGGHGPNGSLVSPQDAEKQLKMTEAIVNSMTRAERRRPDILNGSRRRRIAAGSGTQVQDVNS